MRRASSPAAGKDPFETKSLTEHFSDAIRWVNEKSPVLVAKASKFVSDHPVTTAGAAGAFIGSSLPFAILSIPLGLMAGAALASKTAQQNIQRDYANKDGMHAMGFGIAVGAFKDLCSEWGKAIFADASNDNDNQPADDPETAQLKRAKAYAEQHNL